MKAVRGRFSSVVVVPGVGAVVAFRFIRRHRGPASIIPTRYQALDHLYAFETPIQQTIAASTSKISHVNSYFHEEDEAVYAHSFHPLSDTIDLRKNLLCAIVLIYEKLSSHDSRSQMSN